MDYKFDVFISYRLAVRYDIEAMNAALAEDLRIRSTGDRMRRHGIRRIYMPAIGRMGMRNCSAPPCGW